MAVVRPVPQAQRHRGLRRARVGRLNARRILSAICRPPSLGWRRRRRQRMEVVMTRRFICVMLALGFAAAGAARGQEASPADSVVWKKVHASVFGNAPLERRRRRDHAGYAQARRGRRHRPAGDSRTVPADPGALYRNDLAHHRQQSVADRRRVPLHAGERPCRHRDPDPDRGVHLCPCGCADERRKAVHGRQLRQGVGRLLGARGQGRDRRQGQPRQDAPCASAMGSKRAVLRSPS